MSHPLNKKPSLLGLQDRKNKRHDNNYKKETAFPRLENQHRLKKCIIIIIIIIIIIKDASLNKILTRRDRVACHYHSLKINQNKKKYSNDIRNLKRCKQSCMGKRLTSSYVLRSENFETPCNIKGT